MNFMEDPYESSNGGVIKSFAKKQGKKILVDAIKSISPNTGKVLSAGEELSGLLENPGMKIANKAITSIPQSIGKIGLSDIAGPALAIYSNPTPIANEPMEGFKGMEADRYHREHVNPYVSGSAYGPAPDMATEHKGFESSWRDTMNNIQRIADEEEKRKRNELASKAVSYSVPLIARLANLAGGIYSGM